MGICLSDQQGCRYGEVNVKEWDGNMLKEKKNQLIFIYLFIYLDVLICDSIKFLIILVKVVYILFFKNKKVVLLIAIIYHRPLLDEGADK